MIPKKALKTIEKKSVTKKKKILFKYDEIINLSSEEFQEKLKERRNLA